MYEVRGNELQKTQEVEKQTSFKCGTFGASSPSEGQLATGSFQGHLQVSHGNNDPASMQQLIAVPLLATVYLYAAGCHIMIISCLQMWDLEHTKEPVYTAKAHTSLINHIDGTGGQASLLISCESSSNRLF